MTRTTWNLSDILLDLQDCKAWSKRWRTYSQPRRSISPQSICAESTWNGPAFQPHLCNPLCLSAGSKRISYILLHFILNLLMKKCNALLTIPNRLHGSSWTCRNLQLLSTHFFVLCLCLCLKEGTRSITFFSYPNTTPCTVQYVNSTGKFITAFFSGTFFFGSFKVKLQSIINNIFNVFNKFEETSIKRISQILF